MYVFKTIYLTTKPRELTLKTFYNRNVSLIKYLFNREYYKLIAPSLVFQRNIVSKSPFFLILSENETKVRTT